MTNPDAHAVSFDPSVAEPLPSVPESGTLLVVYTEGARRDGWAAEAAIALARGWRETGRRIFLCDVALEDPHLHVAAGLDNAEGMSDALRYGTSFRRVAHRMEANLFVATAGTVAVDAGTLRDDPRWETFTGGFSDAGALLVLYGPIDGASMGALAERAERVVVLSAAGETVPGAEIGERLDHHLVRGEVETPAAPDDASVAADLGWEADASPADAPEPSGDPATGPDDFGDEMDHVLPGGDEDPMAWTDPLAADDAAVDPPVDRAPAPRPSELDLVDDVEIMPADDEVADISALAPGDPPPAEPDHAPVPADPLAVAGAVAGLDDPAAPDPEIDEVPHATEADYDRVVVAPEREDTEPKSRTGLLLLVLLLVALGVLAAGWFGYVEIPGIPVSSAENGNGELAAAVPSGEVAASSSDADASPAGSAGEASAAPAPGSAPEAELAAFVIALAAFADREDAESERAAWVERASGVDVQFLIAPVEVDGRPWYRLLAGPAHDAAAADGMRRTLAGLAGSDGSGWLVRDARLAFLLGETRGRAAADQRVSVLRSLGIPAHVLRVPYSDGSEIFRVYAGAYASEQEAAYLRSLLNDQDIGNAPLVDRIGSLTG